MPALRAIPAGLTMGRTFGSGLMRAGLLALVLTFATAGAGVEAETAPEPGELSLTLMPSEALVMARRALDLGRPDLAASIAGQVLAQAPANGEASLILAAAQSRRGDAAGAEVAGRKAFRLAQDGDARFEAAFLTASALAAQDRPQRAKFWLRRADDHAQSASDSRLLRKAFQNIDRRTPYRLTFQLSAGPSDNINGGSLYDTFWLDGVFPIPIAVALPGYALQGQAKLSYRVSETADRALSLYAAVSGRHVWLDGRARVLDPTARAGDYGSTGLDLGLNYQMRLQENLGLAVDAQVGYRHLGTGSARFGQRLKVSLDRRLARSRVLSLDLSASATQTPDGLSKDSVWVSAEAGLWLPVGKGAVTPRLGYDAVMTESRGVAWRGPLVGVDVSLPPLAGTVDLALFGTLQMKDYWKTTTDPDMSLEIGATAKFRKLSVMGFAPTLNLTSSRNWSDIVVRDTAGTSVTLGLSSTF